MRSLRPLSRSGLRAAALSSLLAFGPLGCLAESSQVRAPADAGEEDSGARDASRDAAAADARPRDTGVDVGVRDAAGPDLGFVEYTWWGDIRAIVYEKCVSCHTATPIGGAALSLLEWSDTQLLYGNQRVYRIMADKVLTVHQGVRATPTEVEKFQGWAAFGGPEGERPDAGVSDDAGDPSD